MHLATIPITGTGINPARSLGAAVMYNKDKPWDDQVTFCSFSFAFFCCGYLTVAVISHIQFSTRKKKKNLFCPISSKIEKIKSKKEKYDSPNFFSLFQVKSYCYVLNFVVDILGRTVDWSGISSNLP